MLVTSKQKDTLILKPRASITKTIGERLISNEIAAFMTPKRNITTSNQIGWSVTQSQLAEVTRLQRMCEDIDKTSEVAEPNPEYLIKSIAEQGL